MDTVSVKLSSITNVNPTRLMHQPTVDKITASMRVSGLINPIVVHQSGDKHELLDGQHRLAGAKALGWSEIAAIVYTDLKPIDKAMISYRANAERKALDKIATAQAYIGLMKAGNLTATALADLVNVDVATITRTLSLMNLAPELQEMVSSGAINFSVAAELARIESHEAQRELAAAVAKLNRDEAVAFIKRRKPKTKKPKPVKACAAGVTVMLSGGDMKAHVDALNTIIESLKKAIKDNLPPTVIQSLLAKPK